MQLDELEKKLQSITQSRDGIREQSKKERENHEREIKTLEQELGRLQALSSNDAVDNLAAQNKGLEQALVIANKEKEDLQKLCNAKNAEAEQLKKQHEQQKNELALLRNRIKQLESNKHSKK